MDTYILTLDESTVEGMERVKRKEGLDTVDDVIRFFMKDYAAYNQDMELEDLLRRCDE